MTDLNNERVMISAIIPIGNRCDDLAALYREYRAGLNQLATKVETIFVLDGPRPQVAETLRRLQQSGENITIIG